MTKTGPDGADISVSPQALKSFLTAGNWRLASHVRQNAEIWQRGDHELLVPLNPAGPDYQRRIRNVIQDLARAEHGTEEDIARELMYVDSDVVDITLQDVKDVLPLDTAASVLRNAKDLVIASACSAVARKPYHGHSRPLRARQAADVIGMGHTRRDCFIIPLVSPASSLRPVAIGETLGVQELDLGLDQEPSYFPRRVTGMIASALDSIYELAIRPEQTPNSTELRRAVLDGLSADACRATADMIATPGTGRLEVVFRWALSAVRLSSSSNSVEFPAEAAGAIRHIGELLKNQVTLDDTVLYGYVTSLDRDADDPLGTVKVRAFVDGRVRPVKVTLNSDLYHLAAEANDLRLRVIVAGKLLRSATGHLTMLEADSFQMDNYLPMVTTDAWASSIVPTRSARGMDDLPR